MKDLLISIGNQGIAEIKKGGIPPYKEDRKCI